MQEAGPRAGEGENEKRSPQLIGNRRRQSDLRDVPSTVREMDAKEPTRRPMEQSRRRGMD
jgi:hypothetical protein